MKCSCGINFKAKRANWQTGKLHRKIYIYENMVKRVMRTIYIAHGLPTTFALSCYDDGVR